MPAITTTPKALRPFLCHGVSLDWRGREQAVGDCPFCGHEGKFYVGLRDVDARHFAGGWQCHPCGASGNTIGFLRQLWQISERGTRDYEELQAHRGLLSADTLISWNVCRSAITGDWLVPGYNVAGEIVQLYRYIRSAAGRNGQRPGKWLLLATAEMGHGLFGVNLLDPTRDKVFICEGPWDGMALWEVLGGAENVLAVPGCQTFYKSWVSLLAGKDVALLYDSDRPKSLPNGGMSPPAGLTGMRRAAGVLAGEGSPASISYLRWGDDGFDPDLKDGYDIRDAMIAAGNNRNDRVQGLQAILERVRPVPDEWLEGALNQRTDLTPLDCKDWQVVIDAWRNAIKWFPGFGRALSFGLAITTSTKIVGDQLWGKLVGPPSTGKTIICEALAVNKQYVKALSTLRGFTSGYQTDKDGTEDHSLLEQIRNKTLVIKDADPILRSPRRDTILADARDLYDKTFRSHYLNKMSKDYEGYLVTQLWCGTEALRELDASELGERQLDCVIADGINEELENDIALRKINQVRNYRAEANGKVESTVEPGMAQAMRLTGGYIAYLRENAIRLYSRVRMSDETAHTITRLAKFVAFMRARPSKKQDESEGREMSARLVSQLGKLALCLAVVLGKDSVDDTVMAQVRQIALDTARGRTLNLIQYLAAKGEEGSCLTAIAVSHGRDEAKEKVLLNFLKGLKAVKLRQDEVIPGSGVYEEPRWVLTDGMTRLYQEVCADADSAE